MATGTIPTGRKLTNSRCFGARSATRYSRRKLERRPPIRKVRHLRNPWTQRQSLSGWRLQQATRSSRSREDHRQDAVSRTAGPSAEIGTAARVLEKGIRQWLRKSTGSRARVSRWRNTTPSVSSRARRKLPANPFASTLWTSTQHQGSLGKKRGL